VSYGERAVEFCFHPSEDETVARVKKLYAEIIDLCHAGRIATKSGENVRLYSVAITEAQGACMWAVKAITWKDKF
jgi:hypothetical protein